MSGFDPSRLAQLLSKATSVGLTLCTHLKSEKDDHACGCGYAGSVWAADGEHCLFTMGDTLDPEHPELRAPRIPRPQEIATAQLLVELYNAAPALLAIAMEAQRGETEGLDGEAATARAESIAQPDGLNTGSNQ